MNKGIKVAFGAVIFDAYGTLISTGNGSVEAAGKILELNGRTDIDPNKFYAQWKVLHRKHTYSIKNFVTEEKIFETDLRELYNLYKVKGDYKKDVKIMLDTLGKRKAYPEAKEALEKLAEKYTIAIGSTTDTAPLMSDIENNRLKVKKVFTSESLCVYKPRSEFCERILAELNLQAEEALFVGDSITDDIEGPQRVGMRTCWINRKGATAGEIQPDFEINDLKELFNFL